MATTNHLACTLVEQAQAQKEITVNAALTRIDAILNTGATDKDLNTPPGLPATGAVYIVASSPTGAWTSQAGKIAYFDQTWKFITPNEGMRIWVNDEDLLYTYNGSTWSASLNMSDQQLIRPELKDVAETRTAANSGTAYTIDLENGNLFEITLTGNCTFTFSNPPATGKGGSFRLILKQDGTGSRTTTWPASVKWPGGTPPSLSTIANRIDMLSFLTTDAGTTWFGIANGINLS